MTFPQADVGKQCACVCGEDKTGNPGWCLDNSRMRLLL